MRNPRARSGLQPSPAVDDRVPDVRPWSTLSLTDDDLAKARQKMQFARQELVRDHPYLASGLAAMVLVERPGLGTVACDARWRMYYDPARVQHLAPDGSAQGLRILMSDWMHELLHLLRDHPQRWGDLNEPAEQHHLFNIAADAHVNRDVRQMHLPLLDTDTTFENLPEEAGCTSSMVTEEMYFLLLALARRGPSTPEGADGSDDGAAGGGQGGSTTGSPRPRGTRARGRRDADGFPLPGRGDCGSGTGGPQREWEESIDDGSDGSLDPTRAGLVREQVAEAIRAGHGSGMGSGFGSALREWADDVLEPFVDWRRELRSVVSRRIGSSAGVLDYSFVRRSRRRVPGYFLPGTVGAAPPKIAAVIDTSGSMGPAELHACLGDLLGLARAAERDQPAIDVISCDTVAQVTHRVRRPGDVERVRLRGGGGTDMTEGIEAAARLTPAPEVVVVMTDGFTPWPDRPPRELAGSLVIALITGAEDGLAQVVEQVPSWMRVITTRPVRQRSRPTWHPAPRQRPRPSIG